MKKKITFEHMEHSSVLEEHALAKLKKIEDLLNNRETSSPRFIELWLKGHKLHPHSHHAVELHVKTSEHDLHAHEEGMDMYVVLDQTIDKMVRLIKKHKERLLDKKQKVDNQKREFEREGVLYATSTDESE